MPLTWNRFTRNNNHSKRYGISTRQSFRYKAVRKSKRDVSLAFGQLLDSNNSFHFQLLGVGILTLGVILSFQNIISGTSLPTSASDSNSEVRLLTNFQRDVQPGQSQVSYKLAESEAPIVEDIELTSVDKESTTASDLPADNRVYYVVKSGDSLNSIAALFGLETNVLTSLNPNVNFAALQVDQKIVVPS